MERVDPAGATDRFIEGLGGTPDQAVRHASAKLEGYDPIGSVIG